MTFEIWSPHHSQITACDRCLREKRQQILKVIIHTDGEAVLKDDTSQELLLLLLLILILFQVKEETLSVLNCTGRQKKKLFSSPVIAGQDSPKIQRDEKHSFSCWFFGTETKKKKKKCDGSVRARAITDALAGALWRQSRVVIRTCGSA